MTLARPAGLGNERSRGFCSSRNLKLCRISLFVQSAANRQNRRYNTLFISMGYNLFFALLSRSRGSLALAVRLNSPTYAEPFVAPSRTGRYARQKRASVLASFRRGDTYDYIRRARSARMIYFLSESRTRAEPQDEYFLRRYLGSRRNR